jgi:hypothetical protein
MVLITSLVFAVAQFPAAESNEKSRARQALWVGGGRLFLVTHFPKIWNKTERSDGKQPEPSALFVKMLRNRSGGPAEARGTEPHSGEKKRG